MTFVKQVTAEERNIKIRHSDLFKTACEMAGTEPTHRQASKFSRRRGLAYSFRRDTETHLGRIRASKSKTYEGFREYLVKSGASMRELDGLLRLHPTYTSRIQAYAAESREKFSNTEEAFVDFAVWMAREHTSDPITYLWAEFEEQMRLIQENQVPENDRKVGFGDIDAYYTEKAEA